jgi:phosphoglycerate dehydrogenase-like enzyme
VGGRPQAKALGVRVLAVKRDPSSSPLERGVDELAPPSALLGALAGADFVCLAVPLVPDTTGLIGHRERAVMVPHAVLINIARGAVVDEDAPLEALRARRIGGVALDVFREEPLPPGHPFWERPDVLLSPHCVGDRHSSTSGSSTSSPTICRGTSAASRCVTWSTSIPGTDHGGRR